ncbi:MAG: L-2-amino-thiazoline-4-carboxylic acid hydrolase [Candidatus Hodarchaeales archaeon]
MSSMDQMFDYFILLTSKELKKSFDSEEVEEILSVFTKRFRELFEELKEKFNETELFHTINPIFIIALEESLPGKKKDKNQVTRYVLAIYKTMLEDMVLEPQRRFMSLSKDPWVTFTENTRKGNQQIYDNEYFKLKEVSATGEEFAFDINRCFYQEVFKQFGREDLGPIMCEYDSIIAENVAKWVRFEREETIAEGFPKCTFRYYSIKQKFSENPVIDNIHSFLKIIDESDEMLSKQEIMDKGLDAETDLEDITKLIEIIKNHPGIKTSINKEESIFGSVSSFQRHEEWKILFNRKISKEERSTIIRKLPLTLREEKINQLITDILENPYELASIKWICLNYLQHHFSARVGFESEGVDEIQLSYLLQDFSKFYPKMSFEAQSIDKTRVSIQVYGKGVPEYKLKELLQLFRRKIVIDFPDASLSRIQPILSMDRVAKKFVDILEDVKQSFQLRELALRILISRVGIKLVPYLTTISENKKDDPFLRGRAIDSLAWFTSILPQIFDNFEDFKNLPLPIQRSIVDFVTRYGINEELLVAIAKNDNISTIIRKIAIKNLGTYVNTKVTDFLLESVRERKNNEILRQACLEALGKHEVKSRINPPVFEIFSNPEESSFIRMEALETLKDLNYTPSEEILRLNNLDWIITVGLEQLMEE